MFSLSIHTLFSLIYMIQEQAIKIKRGFVDRWWGQVHYRTAGNGPTLVLTHKTYFSSRSFIRVMPLLALNVRREFGSKLETAETLILS